ncbi:MAG TPA: HDIG domain-containing protein [Candidatus Aenigmarchaeota archaeon]|nr:MAG: dihydroneopterin 2',3'-cyclic phosphate phosphodiesterase [Candidatus Aenigmarchaeota archaeon]HDD46561.1 HDIG domain-containing protein [Candidatus Aenigmarchaeota archaeon]
MKELLELAKHIKNKELREMVENFIKKPELTNKKFKYKASKLELVPASINWHHSEDSGLIEHTKSVTKMCIAVADVIENVYNIYIDRDSLVAAAILHDMGKLWEIKRKDNTWVGSNISLDHTFLITSELYARNFPESVIHIIASHFGTEGPTPPQTIEAFILHYIDTLDAVVGTILQDMDIRKILSV